MKTLLLMRHAKSSWKDVSLDDFDRPLNKRGRRDAPRMARWLQRQGCVPERIVASAAVRAKRTAEAVAALPEFDGELIATSDLYHAAPNDCLAELERIPAYVECAMLVGHNPGLEELLEALTGLVESMPTACVARLECPVSAWAEVELDGSCRLTDLWRAREIPD